MLLPSIRIHQLNEPHDLRPRFHRLGEYHVEDVPLALRQLDVADVVAVVVDILLRRAYIAVVEPVMQACYDRRQIGK